MIQPIARRVASMTRKIIATPTAMIHGIGEAAPVDEGEDVPADIGLHPDGHCNAGDVVAEPGVDRLFPGFAAGGLQQNADHDHQRDVHGPVQIALGLAEIGGVEMEDRKGDADDGDQCGGDRGVGNPALADQEFDAALARLRRRGAACRRFLRGRRYAHTEWPRLAARPEGSIELFQACRSRRRKPFGSDCSCCSGGEAGRARRGSFIISTGGPPRQASGIARFGIAAMPRPGRRSRPSPSDSGGCRRRTAAGCGSRRACPASPATSWRP